MIDEVSDYHHKIPILSDDVTDRPSPSVLSYHYMVGHCMPRD